MDPSPCKRCRTEFFGVLQSNDAFQALRLRRFRETDPKSETVLMISTALALEFKMLLGETRPFQFSTWAW